MNSLYFEQVLIPARSVSLTEMLELFFKDNPGINKDDVSAIKRAFAILLETFPNNAPKTDTGNFKPGYMMRFQEHLITLNYADTQVKKLYKLVKRVFAWAGKPRFDRETWDAAPLIVSSQLLAEIQALPLLEGGRKKPKRKNVALDDVEAAYAFLEKPIADMLRIQFLATLRPGEICRLRPSDIKRTQEECTEYGILCDGENWVYILSQHKTKKHIGVKFIPLGLEEQDILANYINWGEPMLPVFKTAAGKPFSRTDYGRKIKKVIDENGLKKFVPHQIRHNGLTDISKNYNRDTARAFAGHTNEKTTAIYDHSDFDKMVAVVQMRNEQYRRRKAVGFTSSAESPILRIFTGE